METALRRFARNVLLIHLALLVALLVFVFLAAREVYQSARAHALVQAQRRQALLAQETARGVQSYYDSILSDLVMMRPVNPEDPDSEYTSPQLPPPSTQPARLLARAAGALSGPMLGRQLNGRLSHLFVLDKVTLRVPWTGIGRAETAPSVADIVVRLSPWLRSLKEPTMSDFQLFDGRGFHFVGIPSPSDRPTIIVAAIPVRRVEQWFFNELNDGPAAAATFLVNDSLQILTTSHRELVGQRISQIGSDEIRSSVASLASQGFRGTSVISDGFHLGDVSFGPSLIATEPLNVNDHHWFVMLTSPLGDVGAIVRQMFSRALFWAVFLACSMTAILVSTATQLIRGRARVEKLRHELIERELAEARKIQLAWLPQGRPADTALDVATANEPASHISGDFYNWFDLPDGRTAFAIGDVTGHGMSAAFLMATTQLLVRTTLPALCDPGACLQQVNHQLCVQAFNGQFVTMVLLIIDPRTGRVELSAAGHPLPLLISQNSAKAVEAEPDLVLGVEADERYRTYSLTIQPGDNLLFYTDGVVDSASPAGERFGLQRLLRCATKSAGSAGQMIDAVIEQVSAFRHGSPRADDVTLLVVRMSAVDLASETAGPRTKVADRSHAPLREAIPLAAVVPQLGTD